MTMITITTAAELELWRTQLRDERQLLTGGWGNFDEIQRTIRGGMPALLARLREQIAETTASIKRLSAQERSAA